MKKLVLSLLVCFAWLGVMQGQVLSSDFLMYGQVLRTSDNTGVANHLVLLYEQNNVGGIIWSDSVYTNASGNYSYTVVNGSTVGPNRVFYAKTYDCQNFAHVVQQQNNQGTTDYGIYNFEICDFNNTCQAGFTTQMQNNNPYGWYFLNASTTTAGTITSWTWDYGDGTVSVNPPNISGFHEYNAPGTYYVCLTIGTSEGCTSTSCQAITVSSPCQNAAGIMNQSTPGGMSFFGYATWNNTVQNNASYAWYWGDGSSTTGGPTVQHNYTQPGTYNVCVAITYDNCTDDYCTQVTIGSNGGNCIVGMNPVQGNGPSYYFVSTGNGVSPISYTYFVDGQQVSSGPATYAYQATTYGGHTVCVTATDANGCTASACDSFYYANPCNANFTYTPANIPNSYYVNPVYAGGLWYGQYIPNPNGLVTFPGPGTYNLCYVQYMNGDSCDHCETFIVGNGNSGCVADFDWYYANNTQNTIVFNNNSDSNNNGGITSYLWSFGDGSSSTNANPDHHYQQSGWYPVCLTITTANGCTSTFCDSVAIAPSNVPCQASFVSTQQGSGIYIFDTTSDLSLNHQWSINGQQFTGTSATYIFSQPGTYQACLTVWNNAGCQDTECHTIVVTGDSMNVNPCTPSFTYQQAPVNLLEYTFQSTANPNLQQVWNINGQTFTGGTIYYTFPGPGTYQVCLSVGSDTCYGSQCEVIYVGSQDSTICNASFTYSAQNGGYTFVSTSNHSLFHDWVIDNNFTYQGYDFTYQLDPGTHTVCLTVYNNGCQDTQCQTIVVGQQDPNCTGVISGNVSYSDVNCNICVNDAIALLYELTPGDSGTVANLVNVTLVNQGNYSFSGLCGGDYIVQAMIAPNSPNYLLYMPTYSVMQAQWYNSPVLTVSGNANLTADVSLIRLTNPGGNGNLGGGIVIPGDSVRAMGPVQGIKVYVTNQSGVYVSYTMSDAMGNFTLSNLPYDTYTLCADYPGFITACQQFTIDANNPTITDIQLDFEHATVGVKEENANVQVGNLYPNPANSEAYLNIELAKATKLNINIINTLGQVVYSQNLSLQAGKQLLNIPVSGLAQGLYNLTITDDAGNKPVTKKLLKQ